MDHRDDQDILEKNVETRRVFDGLILHVDHLTNELPNGELAKRECARHIGASAIIPVDDQGNVWLVRQFRACIDRVLMEIPAGKLERKDEDRLEAAKRELSEETGLVALSGTGPTEIYTAPGFSDERISLYLARGLSRGDSHPDDDEFLNVVKVPLDDLVDAIARGDIRDAKTICAVMLAAPIVRADDPSNT